MPTRNIGVIISEKLNEHLKVCSDCPTYMSAIKETEKVLQKALQKQWRNIPLPHRKVVLPKRRDDFLTTRRLLISLATTMFFFAETLSCRYAKF